MAGQDDVLRPVTRMRVLHREMELTGSRQVDPLEAGKIERSAEALRIERQTICPLSSGPNKQISTGLTPQVVLIQLFVLWHAGSYQTIRVSISRLRDVT